MISNLIQYAPVIGGVVDPGYRYIKSGVGYQPNGFTLTGYISEADAQLLAAAPKLLQSLKDSIEREYKPFEDIQSNRYVKLQNLHIEITGGTA